ncbi:ATP-dependent sacrificial sulfur transferase LarE [Georgenia sp. 311]|uniref:ATP-dependent sacrificial sulfur transferase LarE n=1 Tax=Georgenia sp. 311 TaxID=2585134 RepID=UPI0011119BA9|nr:ATP-dependent sacrificial sulfur transferase LarE [Georgenia sp. 311]TNC16564.1 ATP-dependent sacrificial sulfur transferase LarE [Georgenia sp. 311]
MTTTTAVPGLTGPVAQAAERVEQMLAGHAPLGVAYSGGVDSATLLAMAVRTLGPANVVAVLGVSPSLATDERARAHETAAVIGARVVEIETHEGQSAAYRANGPDRCFHCKDELFTRIDDELVAELGLAAVAYGENADDAKRPDRPGSQAATNHRVLRPLAEAGMTKAMVRETARALALPVADKPAAPCLASRIPHFEEVTPEKLRQVDRAEAGLRRLGFTDSRVRHHGDVARIELRPEELLVAVHRREDVDAAVRAAGFRFVALDLRGIQSGAFTLPLVTRSHD